MIGRRSVDDGRKCCRCGAGIGGSMGFVLARDMLPLMDPLFVGPSLAQPRELCGRCALAFQASGLSVESWIRREIYKEGIEG